MYSPPHFRVDDAAEAARMIRENPFGIIYSTSDSGGQATHIPLAREMRMIGRD